VPIVFVEKIETLDDPGIEAAAHVPGNFFNDMTPVF
jgi:hypothetical protein